MKQPDLERLCSFEAGFSAVECVATVLVRFIGFAAGAAADFEWGILRIKVDVLSYSSIEKLRWSQVDRSNVQRRSDRKPPAEISVE